MKRYWKALLIVLMLSAQQSPVGWRNGTRRAPRRNQMAADGIALALASSAGCESHRAATRADLKPDGIAIVQVAAARSEGDLQAVPIDAAVAVVRTAIRGYTDHGNAAYLPDSAMAAAVGVGYAPSIEALIAQGGKTDDFLVHVSTGVYMCGPVPISIVLEGLHPANYRQLTGHDTWIHSSHFIAERRDDGSWAVAKDAAQPGFTP